VSFKKTGAACLKYIQKSNLTKSIGGIASKVASTKTSMKVGDGESARIAKPIKQDSRGR